MSLPPRTGVCAGLLVCVCVCVCVCLLSVWGVAWVRDVHLCVSGTVLPGCVSMCCENHCVSGCVSLSGTVCLDDFVHVSFPLCLRAPCLSVWPQIPPVLGCPAHVSPSPSSPFSASPLLGALTGYHVTVCARWPERGPAACVIPSPWRRGGLAWLLPALPWNLSQAFFSFLSASGLSLCESLQSTLLSPLLLLFCC